ncbi:uncharacterized protein [Nicotiana sylvestris]|uniref:uncharacterized protein n=1 Tax=Nicotiana sylvestris TaxID=4096 RepID=UPI00388CD5E9
MANKENDGVDLAANDAKQWFRSLPTGSINTWEDITRKFLDKYFSPTKIGKFIMEIHNFYQKEREMVFEAWERFKEIKTLEEVVLILDELSEDVNQWPVESNDKRKSVEVHQVDSNTSMQTHLDTMAKGIRMLILAKQNNPRLQDQGPLGFQNQQRQQYQLPQPNQSSMEDLMKAFINKTDEKFHTRGTAIQNLESQMGQIANLLFERDPGTLPSDTEKNPKEIIKVVVNKQTETPVEKKSEEQKGQISGVQKEIEESSHMSALPFPQKMKREKLDKCFGRFLEMLKQFYVNIPFIEVLTQMLAYAKFLKEILSSKRKLEKTTVVKLNGPCSAILKIKILKKCRDPGSFTIPCSLGSDKFDKALYDSGVSINIMPQSAFKKLKGELGLIKSIPVSLQLADQITILPKGIIEDILVRVDKFVFPIDFIVVDLEVNKDVPLILWRSFYVQAAILDIYEGQLMFRMGNEKVVFRMKRMMKYPSDEASAYSCFKLDVIGKLAEKYNTLEDEDPEIRKEAEVLETEDQVVDDEELKEEACTQEQKLGELLKKHKKAIDWSIPDIKGISPAICMPKFCWKKIASKWCSPNAS